MNLEYFMKTQKLNRRQAYQILYLSRFDFILKNVPEIKTEKADCYDSKILKWVNKKNLVLE